MKSKRSSIREAYETYREPGSAEISGSLGMPWRELPTTSGLWEKLLKPRSWRPIPIESDNAPTAKQLEAYFRKHPDALDRLVYCGFALSSSGDSTPSSLGGYKAYSEGFAFINGARYGVKAPSLESFEAFSDFLLGIRGNVSAPDSLDFAAGLSKVQTPSGRVIPVVDLNQSFPSEFFHTQHVTREAAPEAYAYIVGLFNNPPGEPVDVSGIPQTAIGAAILNGGS